MTQLDLLIEHGTIVDGTGATGRAGAVGVREGRIVLQTDGMPAARTIDATGMVVAPGFIDMHSHSGLMILADPAHEPKVRQGVTTEVIGVDGLSYAPIADPDDVAALVNMNAGLDGRPDIAANWSTVETYLDRLDAAHMSVNVAMLVGNSALRIGAVGWEEVEASPAQVANMRAMLREAMEQGAVGLSSGLDYPPGAYASTDELADLTAEAARNGGFYHTHVRYALGDRYLDPFSEAIEIGRRGSGPVHLTHFYHRQTHPGGPERLLALVDDARARGEDVTFDCYPYEWASTRLLIQLPIWIQAGGPAPLMERLADSSARERLRADFAARGVSHTAPAGWADVRLGAFTLAENLPLEGWTLADVMADRGCDAVDAICDLLLGEHLGVNQVTSGPWSETLPLFVRHPVGTFGTDSTFISAKPSPRTYGSFPRVLGQFVRDEALLSLEEAVRKMTSAAAQRLGLADRGLVRDGLVADLIVFDPRQVRSNATYAEPRRYPDGIRHVIVNGRAVVSDGAMTDARPGHTIRRATAV